jgi:hypothetical protein
VRKLQRLRLARTSQDDLALKSEPDTGQTHPPQRYEVRVAVKVGLHVVVLGAEVWLVLGRTWMPFEVVRVSTAAKRHRQRGAGFDDPHFVTRCAVVLMTAVPLRRACIHVALANF